MCSRLARRKSSSPRARDLLEPGRDPLGRHPGGPLSAAPGARCAARPAARYPQPRLPVGGVRQPAPGRRSALRPLPAAVRRREGDADRGYSRPLDRTGLAGRQGRQPRHSRDRGERDRDPGGGAAGRRTGLQSLEHHRPLPPARQPQPGPQDRLRRQFGPSPGLSLPDRRSVAQPGDAGACFRPCSSSSTGSSRGTNCPCA